MCINRLRFLLFSIVSILFLTASGYAQKTAPPILLHDEKLNFTPKEFYIANVTDERPDQHSIASLEYKDEAHSYANRQADLKDGAAKAIQQFINRNLVQNTSSRPVIISIKELKLIETGTSQGAVNGHLSIDLSFGLKKDYGTLKLVEYKGGIKYTRPDNQADAAEQTLRHGIENALSWFNNWINKNADNDVRLAKKVEVKFTDYTEKPEGDTVYYSPNRPLTWNDFKEKADLGAFDAEVFTSIGYGEHASVQKGVIKLDIAIKVDMPKSDCLVKSKSENDYALNHEQRHFDIAKLVAEHFKQKILSQDLPADNYDGDIHVEYLETLRELHRMQTQYDNETHHGRNGAMQAQWDRNIDKQLKALGIK
jgi:hypothetical protein